MPTRLNIPLKGRPCGKARHYSKAAADGHRAALEAHERRNGRVALNVGELAVYRCEACGGAWHVGHRSV